MATEVRLVREGVSLYEDDRLLDKGKLIIKESSVDWEGENRQFSLEYQNICLHAVSSTPYGGDENAKFPHPHVYLMVEGDRVWSNGETIPPNGDTGMEIDNGESSDDEQGDYPQDDNPPTYSLRFLPTDEHDLQPIYDAIAECQALNPDPDDMSDGDFEDVAEENENGVEENGLDQFDPDDFAYD
ncbi:unnamed protein product [Rodentolepis nana]|uniref:Methylosome subunit pICln n=1 Tax=Rodentolepis nana TaxID=102285 RepID=A0A0R3TTM2_RODNA|nr:unnamed protein product [Rodentolepis nana]